jgi:hypothetical protein
VLSGASLDIDLPVTNDSNCGKDVLVDKGGEANSKPEEERRRSLDDLPLEGAHAAVVALLCDSGKITEGWEGGKTGGEPKQAEKVQKVEKVENETEHHQQLQKTATEKKNLKKKERPEKRESESHVKKVAEEVKKKEAAWTGIEPKTVATINHEQQAMFASLIVEPQSSLEHSDDSNSICPTCGATNATCRC